MAVSGRRRVSTDKDVGYQSKENDFVVDVSRTKNKCCVTVDQQPERAIVVQHLLPERCKAPTRE